MILCMCVCVGGTLYLSQVKKSKYLEFSEDRMFGLLVSHLRTRIFSLSQTETFRFIHVIMKI